MDEKKSYQKGLLIGIAGGILGSLVLVSICIVIGVNVVVARDGALVIGEKEPTTTITVQQTTEENNNQNTGELIDSNFIAKVNKIYKMLDKNFLYEIDDDKLREGMYSGMVAALGDPYSVYYTEEEFKSFNESSEGIYYGIGVSVTQNVKTGVITFVRVFKNAPSYEAGLKKGDILYAVNDTEITGMELAQVVNMIKGVEGSTVKITVVREGEADYLSFDVERRQVEMETVTYEMLDNSIGYILVTGFEEVTTSQFINAIAELSTNGMQGLIIDMRDNPGGRLDVVIPMLDMLLPEGILIYTEDKNGNKGSEYYSDPNSVLTVPLAVLVNENSASAAEVFAGDIQDFGAGTLVGTKTFGKGIVQTAYPLGDSTGIKFTVSSYFTHAGRNIHGTGIEPDVVVELNEEAKLKADLDKADDNQLQKAVEILIEQIKQKSQQ